VHLQQAHPLLKLPIRLIDRLPIDRSNPIALNAISLDYPPAPPAASVEAAAVIR
jgi:hypothetical protein